MVCVKNSNRNHTVWSGLCCLLIQSTVSHKSISRQWWCRSDLAFRPWLSSYASKICFCKAWYHVWQTQLQMFGDVWEILTLIRLNKLRCHTHFKLSANEITWSRLLIHIHILNDKQCRSRSVGFCRSQLIWIYTVCKCRIYLGSAGQGLKIQTFFVGKKVFYLQLWFFFLTFTSYWANSADNKLEIFFFFFFFFLIFPRKQDLTFHANCFL